MNTIRNENMIKLALDTIDLVILRWQVDEAMSNKPVDRQEHYRLTRARELVGRVPHDGGDAKNTSSMRKSRMTETWRCLSECLGMPE